MNKYILSGLMTVILGVTGVGTCDAAGFFKVGEPAPDFTLTSLKGKTVSLGALRGHVVVLGLFHICKPCLIQSIALQKVYEETRGKNVVVIGVNASGDSESDVKDFLRHFPVTITYPYLLDPSQETDRLYGGGRFIPNVYVIDPGGIIRWQRVGNMDLAGHEVIAHEVEKLLSQSAKTDHRL